MTISISDTFTHKASCDKKVNSNNQELQKVISEKINELGVDLSLIKWNGEGNLQIQQSNNMTLHKLMLEMEKLGLEMKMTKQTLIELN